MLFKLINVSNLEWDKAVDFEADSIDAACEYVLKNAYKFSNWHIFRDDTVQLCYKTVDGGWFIAAFIDLHKNEVVTKLYDRRRAPEPYVETSEQGESVDVENTSASEQDNTVEKSSDKSSHRVSFNLRFPDNSSVDFFHEFFTPDDSTAGLIVLALDYGLSHLCSKYGFYYSISFDSRY